MRYRRLGSSPGGLGDRAGCLADEPGLELVALALAWFPRRPEFAAAIVGVSKPEQVVVANCAAPGVGLSDDVLAAIDTALGDAPVRSGDPWPPGAPRG